MLTSSTQTATNFVTIDTRDPKDTVLNVADLVPLAGLADEYDEAVFTLCDTTASTAGDQQLQYLETGQQGFCRQLRRALDADTVYLCKRRDLSIVCSSIPTADGSIHADTQCIHAALTYLIDDLQYCDLAIRLPNLRVFKDCAKMSLLVFPVGARPDDSPTNLDANTLLAIVADADTGNSKVTQYQALAIQAIYQRYAAQQTLIDTNPAPLSTNDLQKHVMDTLHRHYPSCSEKIAERRYQIYLTELRNISVHFEKLTEQSNTPPDALIETPSRPQATDGTNKVTEDQCWGWQVVASCTETNQFPTALFATAKQWGGEFLCALDLHLLREATHRYKAVCEAANLTRFSEIRPLCLRVHPVSLAHTDYVATLRDLIEKAIIQGPQLVFEVAAMPTQTTVGDVELAAQLQHLANCCETLRQEFGVRIALDETTTGNLILSRFLQLMPEVIKLDQVILTGENRLVAMELVEDLAHVTGQSNHPMRAPDNTPTDALPPIASSPLMHASGLRVHQPITPAESKKLRSTVAANEPVEPA